MRLERDALGQLQIPDNALYGIHSLRAKNNFPDTSAFHLEWYQAMGTVKLAFYLTYNKFKKAVKKQYSQANLDFIEDKVIEAMIYAAQKVAKGDFFEHFIIPAIQGGAGTSINMNVNEIITNVALIYLKFNPGEYNIIHPIEHANLYQSTNDTVPTALKIAAMRLLNILEEQINQTRTLLENLEKKHHFDLRIAYTQLQEAVPSTFGKLFGAYAEALSRDWWRLSKCFERLKFVNLGGSAIGTALSVPRFIVVEVIPQLRQLTKLPIAQAENLYEQTQNLDPLVEVSAILKTHAVNLEKIVSDLRLMASDFANRKEISIPKVQTGSSIMPSKINPVIPEFVISIAHKVYTNDMLITQLAGMGQLELNAYLPLIGHALLENIKLLISANKALNKKMINNLKVNTSTAYKKLLSSPSITTALNHIIGYNKAAELAQTMRKYKCDILEANKILGYLIDEQQLKSLLNPSKLLQKGWRIKDLLL